MCDVNKYVSKCFSSIFDTCKNSCSFQMMIRIYRSAILNPKNLIHCIGAVEQRRNHATQQQKTPSLSPRRLCGAALLARSLIESSAMAQQLELKRSRGARIRFERETHNIKIGNNKREDAASHLRHPDKCLRVCCTTTTQAAYYQRTNTTIYIRHRQRPCVAHRGMIATLLSKYICDNDVSHTQNTHTHKKRSRSTCVRHHTHLNACCVTARRGKHARIYMRVG